MTHARALAGEIAFKVGVDPASVLAALTLLIKAWIEIRALCKEYERTPAGLRDFAKDHPDNFRRRCRRAARREGVPRDHLEWVVDEMERRVIEGTNAEMAAVFAEVQAAGEDTGEWPDPH